MLGIGLKAMCLRHGSHQRLAALVLLLVYIMDMLLLARLITVGSEMAQQPAFEKSTHIETG